MLWHGRTSFVLSVFIEADQRLAGFVFVFLIPTSQSLLSEQARTSQLALWGKHIAYKAVWKLQVADLHERSSCFVCG